MEIALPLVFGTCMVVASVVGSARGYQRGQHEGHAADTLGTTTCGWPVPDREMAAVLCHVLSHTAMQERSRMT